MPDDPTALAYADAVTRAREKMRATLTPKLVERAAAYKKANDAFLPAARSAFESLADSCKKAEATALASYDARIREITKSGDLDAALALKTVKGNFQAYLPKQADEMQADFAALASLDPEKALLEDRRVDDFRIESMEVIPYDATSVQVRARMEACFPVKNNRAREGTAKASSTSPEAQDPIVTLGGNRHWDCWAIAERDPKPSYWASWDPERPAMGKYILIWGRTCALDGCPWGNARIQVNNLPPKAVKNMGQLKLLLIELDRVAPITSVKIELGNGVTNAGIAGLEIHREMKTPLPR
jgi:hypothetical protein